MKKFIKISLPIVISILIVAIVIYEKTYSIDFDHKKIEFAINDFLNKGNNINGEDNLKITYMADFDNKMYVLFTSGNELGYAELNKGLNNHFKIISVTNTSRQLWDKIIETNKGKYWIEFGDNSKFNIKYIEGNVQGIEYKLVDIPKNYFIRYCSIPSASTSSDPRDMKYIDVNNNDITKNIY